MKNKKIIINIVFCIVGFLLYIVYALLISELYDIKSLLYSMISSLGLLVCSVNYLKFRIRRKLRKEGINDEEI